MYSTDSVINGALLATSVRSSGLKAVEFAGLLGVHGNTWLRWRKDWVKMPVEALVLLCQVLKLDIADVLWFENKECRQDVLTAREIEMIRRDNQNSRTDICKYFNISTEYYHRVKSRADIYLVEYSCIPPLGISRL